MLASITLENFFSFDEPTTINLNPGVNVLVGINGSGKSNFIKAIRLLYEGIIGKGFEKIFLGEWGGFRGVSNFSGAEKGGIRILYEFDNKAIKNINSKTTRFFLEDNLIYEITIFPFGNTSYYLKERVFLKDKNLMFLNAENGKGNIRFTQQDSMALLTSDSLKVDDLGLKENLPILSQINEPLRFPQLFIIRKAIETLKLYDPFDVSLNSEIRKPAPYSTEESLQGKGLNLVSTLSYIQNNHAKAFEELNKAIKNVNPQFKGLEFSLQGNFQLISLKEAELDRPIPLVNISDGTLQFLLLCSIFYNPERGNLICIDEPETGLHPDMINTIANLIKKAANDGTQLIIATHSPLLLNKFSLEEVLIFEKNSENQSVVLKKTEEEFEELVNKSSVGQLWLRGLIGGKRW